MDAKKSLSQNFLINPQIRIKVARTLKENTLANQSTEIVEIGPGTGLLTTEILSLQLPTSAIEIDPRAIELLQASPHLQDLKLIAGDAIELINNKIQWQQQGLPTQDFILFGNLPFNTGSRLIVDFCLHYPHVPMTVILQKEVVDKLTKDNHLTFLAAWILLFHTVQHSFVIPAGNFSPKPKVDTALINLSPTHHTLPNYLKSLQQRQTALQTIKSLFQFPRKTIGNNLKSAHPLFQKLSDSHPDILEHRLNKINFKKIIDTILNC